MKLYGKDGIIVAIHDDHQSVPASTYGSGTVVVPYAGALGDLERVGEPPDDPRLDARPYRMPAAPAVPAATHAAWLRLALHDLGRLADVEAAVAQAGGATEVLWRSATTISRADPEVVAIGQALTIDLDSLFVRAEAIRLARGA
jgi:hypothetical protein